MAGYELALEGGEARTTAHVRGRVDVHGAAALLAELGRATRGRAGDLALDLSGVDYFDSGGAAALALLRRDLAREGRTLTVVGARPEVDRLLGLVDADAVSAPKARGRRATGQARLGATARDLHLRCHEVVAFAGEIALGLADAVRHPGKIRWRETLVEVQRAGADSLPIVTLVASLIGLITGFQSLIQLRAVGADIYVANLVGLTTTRELGPLMTAVVACGRSGAAYAAELGTMKVTEEVDALVTLGLDRTRFLVTPRVLALVLMLPCLTVYADLLGLAGGMLVADLSADVPPSAYLRQAQWALEPQDFWTGLVKAATFGLIIAAVGCLRGLQARGGAESVGLATTSAVVTSLTLVIVADAGLTAIFDQYGL